MARSTRASLGLLALPLIGALTLAPPLLYAGPTCGQVLTATTWLNQDLHCESMTGITTALTLGVQIVLHLNGFTIYGPGGTQNQVTGVSTTNGPFSTIEGPGTITGFAVGISLNADSDHVKHVHVISNYLSGIEVNSQRNTVSNNTIVGNGDGIDISNGNNKIIGNAITQIPPNVGVGVGINIALCGCSVLHNTVTNNFVGLISNTGFDNIASNDFSANTEDGIQIWGPQASVLNNQANANGRDGISLLNGVYGVLVQNNTTNSNGRRGIGLDGLGGTSDSNTIKGNRALGNNPDLFWDGNGTGNAWTFNVCDTYIGISPKPCF